MFLHHHIPTRLDLIRPDYPSRVLAKQAQQKAQHDQRAQEREFFVGQSVMARNMRPGPDWVPVVVIERLGPLTYLVETAEHLLWKRHIDLLRELKMDSQTETPQSTESDSSDLEIPLGDTTLMGIPSEESITPPEPLVRTGTKILSLRLPDIQDVFVDLQIGMVCMLVLSSMFELSQKECSMLRLIMLCYLCFVIICNDL